MSDGIDHVWPNEVLRDVGKDGSGPWDFLVFEEGRDVQDLAPAEAP